MPHLGCTASPPVPWGTHLCSFYDTRSQLHQLVAAYLSRGLQDHEGCLWILPPWHSLTTATVTLQRTIPKVFDYLATVQLELISSAEWYGWPEPMDIARICAEGRDKIRRLSARFAGLRVVGDLSWVTSPEQRAQVLDYEGVVDEVVQETNVLALCTYPATDSSSPADRQEVLTHHQSVLLPNQVGWSLVDVRCG
jgi:hypothetical protein